MGRMQNLAQTSLETDNVFSDGHGISLRPNVGV
jgi:hypothetical protein